MPNEKRKRKEDKWNPSNTKTSWSAWTATMNVSIHGIRQGDVWTTGDDPITSACLNQAAYLYLEQDGDLYVE